MSAPNQPARASTGFREPNSTYNFSGTAANAEIVTAAANVNGLFIQGSMQVFGNSATARFPFCISIPPTYIPAGKNLYLTFPDNSTLYLSYDKSTSNIIIVQPNINIGDTVNLMLRLAYRIL